ncbi:MAG: hypothetical protein ACRDSH_11720 [Pseudonocardiaceae bacterium]
MSRRAHPGAYYCGWAITGRVTASHLVASDDFPTAGSQHRAWCGQTVTVIGLTLDARGLPDSCADCNRLLRRLARASRVGEQLSASQ